MSVLLENDIWDRLRGVSDEGTDIVTRGMVRGLHIQNGHVTFSLEVDPTRGTILEPLRHQAEQAVATLPAVTKVTAVLTAQKKVPDAAKMDPHGMAKNPPLSLPIKHIIAVASGKGGVGKSTVAFNLAVALAQAGQTVGLLDADIYGPSVPLLSGIRGQKPQQDKDGRIIPLEAHNLKLMSIGFMVDDESPMIWRGPMVQTALYQMLRDVNWATPEDPIDILIVDMPPGTGDAQLTMAQKVPMAGAIIVSTPQDLALIDARKAIEMFRKVNVPVLGLIENMSTHICSACGHEEHIFGHGGAQDEAHKQNVPYLGAIPLTMDIRKAADNGQPMTNYYRDFAKKIIDGLK